jgi:Transglycosylase SLT domain
VAQEQSVAAGRYWFDSQEDTLAPYYAQIEKAYNLPPGTMKGLVAAENTAPGVTSSAQAQTQFQIIPSTARDLGVNLSDPRSAMEGAAKYYRQQLDTFGDPGLAYAAYNAGPGTVQQALKNKSGFSPGVNQYMKTGLSFTGQNSDYTGFVGEQPEDTGQKPPDDQPAAMSPLSAPVPKQPEPPPGTVLGPLAGSPAVKTPLTVGDRLHRFGKAYLEATQPGWADLGNIIAGLRGEQA